MSNYDNGLINILKTTRAESVWFTKDGEWFFKEKPNTTKVSRDEILGVKKEEVKPEKEEAPKPTTKKRTAKK